MRPQRAVGTVAVAATYLYFLIFAQFGFLQLLERAGAGEGAVRRALAAMGVAGLLTSLATARLLGRVAAARVVRWGLVSCSASALAAVFVTSPSALVVVAGAVGAATALLTVSLASDLRRWVGGNGFGLRVGLGTGAAYFLCNVPALFAGAPELQASVAAAVCALVAVVATGEGGAEATETPVSPVRFDGGVGLFGVVAGFLALVWLDSAGFAIIQNAPELRALTWSGGRIWLQGSAHLAGALLAGWWIDRGRFFSLLPGSFVLFALGFRLLAAGQAVGGPIYALGIAAYSTALVAFPSLGPQLPGSWPPRWRAALVFGVAGWLGSGLGVGMAERLHEIPGWFLGTAGATLALAAAAVWRNAVGRVSAIYGAPVALAVAGWLLAVAAASHRDAPGTDRSAPSAVERGREVYIAEGCVHCHSQYVRPQTFDEEIWGPFRPLDRDREVPALLGNRRLGPDLRNVGNRRSAVWQRLHLEAPRRLSPGSLMPSYEHLFAGGSRRGEDLVAYLDSLGKDTGRDHYAAAQRHAEPALDAAPSESRGRRLFVRNCAVCHGEQATGDGPFAELVAGRAMNLRKDGLWLVSWGPGIGSREEGLARVIRFGVPATSMPGHETLPARDVADLVSFVSTLPGSEWEAASTEVAGAAYGAGAGSGG